MNKYVIAGVAVVVGLLVGIFGFHSTQRGGDFPQGIAPSQLWTGNALTGFVQAISGLPNLLVPGTALINDMILYINGFNPTFTTSTVMSAGIFCGATAAYIPAGAPSGINLTFPSATAVFATCPGNAGSANITLVTND